MISLWNHAAIAQEDSRDISLDSTHFLKRSIATTINVALEGLVGVKCVMESSAQIVDGRAPFCSGYRFGGSLKTALSLCLFTEATAIL